MEKKLVSAFAITLVLVAAALVWPSDRSIAQSSETVISYLEGDEPLRIVSIVVQGKKMALGKGFTGEPEWLSTLSLNLENRGDKKITYVDVGVIVDRPKDQEGEPPFHFNMDSGNKGAALRHKDTGLSMAKGLDNQGSVSMSRKEYDSIRNALNNLGYPLEIKHIRLQVEEIGYEDGTLWSMGVLYRADPKDLSKLIRIPRP